MPEGCLVMSTSSGSGKPAFSGATPAASSSRTLVMCSLCCNEKKRKRKNEQENFQQSLLLRQCHDAMTSCVGRKYANYFVHASASLLFTFIFQEDEAQSFDSQLRYQQMCRGSCSPADSGNRTEGYNCQ